jgi:hypothetical protein
MKSAHQIQMAIRNQTVGGIDPHAALVLCHRQKFGLSHSLEKGVRYRKCKAPFGPFRFSVPDPVFPAHPKS